MHGDIFGSCGVTFKLDHHTNAGAVQVTSQFGARCKPVEPAKAHVFTDLAYQTFAHIFKRRAKPVLRI